MNEPFPIDAVITWVDGDDPTHRAKRLSWMHGGLEARHDDVAGETRYRQVGEIAYCVGSILRFAPFVRRIFIVTDNQNPRLEEFLSQNFPDNRIPVEIVDHTTIFRGYEQYLPTFNSLSIETMLWRIPGLAEHYIYMNDDFTIVSPVTSGDFFDSDGRPVCYADPIPVWWARLLHWLKPRRDGRKPFGFKDSMLNAERLAGLRRRFLRIDHTPQAMNAAVLRQIYESHPEYLDINLRHRFRHAEQYNPQSLMYAVLLPSGGCRVVSPAGKLVYMKPRAGRTGYVGRKLAAVDASPEVLFCCINSLDAADACERAEVREWMNRRLSIVTE